MPITMDNLAPKDEMYEAEIASLKASIGQELASRYHVSGLNLSFGDLKEEYVPELLPLQSRVKTLERMINDPQVRGQYRAITMTIVSSVRWKAIDGSEKMREFVSANFFGEGDPDLACSSSWLDILNESFGALVYGFSLWGKTYESVDGRIVLRDLCWLHPRSVDEDGWVMDEHDNLLGVRRSYSDATGTPHTRETTPVDDLFILPWDSRGPNWEGNAFIRPMYRPWKLGELAEKIDMIDLQNRGVGIPMAKLGASSGKQARDTLVEMLKSLRGGSKERAFICLGTDEDISFLTSQGQVKDSIPTLEYHRSNKVKAGGTEYFEQGNTATGSRAGASALATGFFINVNGIRTIIEDKINRGTGKQKGLVRDLIDRNFSRDEIRKHGYCRIVGSTVSPTEQLDNIPLVGDSIQKGALTKDFTIENEIRRRLDYPMITREEFDRLNQEPPVNIGGRPNQAGPDAQGRDDREGRRLGLSEKKTSGATQQTRSAAYYPWLRSTPA